MAASGGGGGGGGGLALPPGLASVLRHMLAVDEDDFDCTIELVFPQEPPAEAATEDTEGPPAKRARLAAGTEDVAFSQAGEPAAGEPAAAEPAAADGAAAEPAAAGGAAAGAAAADDAAAGPAAADGAAAEAAAADGAVADATTEAAAADAAMVDAAAAEDTTVEAAANEAAAADGVTVDGAAAETTVEAAANAAAAADGAAADGAAATSTITCRASSVALKQHSEVFRRWIKGWSDGQRKVLHIECEDRQEAQAFQQLLAFVHSAGRALPTEPLATLQLLGVARKHGVEACVDACLQLLLTQVHQLPLPACLRLVLLLETGASGHAEVQAQADQLLKKTCERLQTLVKEEAATVLADAALLEALVAFFGRWHSTLNCSLRHTLWRTLPFELLSLMFEDSAGAVASLAAATQATNQLKGIPWTAVLAAFATWAKANIGVQPFDPGQRDRVAAVCSRIRFPEVPPDVLMNYWTCFKWLQAYDPNKDLLLCALATANDSQQPALWLSSLSDPPLEGDAADGAAAKAVTTECLLWWTPRVPALVSDTDEVVFQLQIDRPSTNAVCIWSNALFWHGYWWCVDIKRMDGNTGMYLRGACSDTLAVCTPNTPDRRTYRVKATYRMVLHLNGTKANVAATRAFPPATLLGWGFAALDAWMAASGSGGGGGGARPPGLGAVLRHMLDVDEDDFDCSIELAFPNEPDAVTATVDTEAPPAKRTRRATAAEAAQADDAAKTAASSTPIVCRASSVMLKLHSEAFRRWIKGWAGGQKEALRIECEDRQEVEAFQQLLAFVHSAGRTLPNEPLATLRQLAVARRHGVESCVDACLQLLLTQAWVDQLPLPACLRLVLLLETGAIGHEEVQAQADKLVERCGEHLQTVLKKESAAVLADAALKEDLAAVFGRWHGMLNCAVRRGLWLALPFELLSAMFEDRHVQADSEATVLAAFALWASANIFATVALTTEQRDRIAAVCSRIRFPKVPPGVLLVCYLACFKWLQRFDPNKDLLLRAITTAADSEQRALWQSSLSDPPLEGDEADAADAQAAQAECLLCPLLICLVVQIDKLPITAARAFCEGVYWRGYWWRGEVYKSADSFGTSAGYSALLQIGGAKASSGPSSTSTFAPARTSCFWDVKVTKDSSGEPISWERFWAADSPFLHDGRARLELTLSVPRS
ncbi:hypothetical protein COHA_004271 [Chlorella ohadii]|uniref:BTB domain-containing protein n=1 Tax=Chlorella ohadii TaxID=2649997 RepID=A0AAD5H6L0_9CHLO|nr:hypothetical protein COHA_004271 [Chlorella ohadii]